jgi:transposase
VSLPPAQFVKMYLKTDKNDAREAEAICEAVAQPSMRLALIKTVNKLCQIDRSEHFPTSR